MVIAFFLVITTIVPINGNGLNLFGSTFHAAQSQSNFTSVEQQQLMDRISFEIDNVTFSHHMAPVNGIQFTM